MDKINFQNDITKVNADTFNTFQNNIEKSAVIVSKNEPTTNEKVWFRKGKNLVNKINYGRFFSTGSSTPKFENNAQFASTDFIEIKQNVDYIFSHQLGSAGGDIVCFDSNYNYIEKINNQAITTKFNITNENVKYIIINMYDSNGITETNESWAQLEQNSIATPYEAYIEPKIYVKNDNGIYEEFIRKDENAYSTDEKKIGTWIDGTPIYRKTKVFSSGWKLGNEAVFNIGVSDIAEILGYSAFYKRSDNTFQIVPNTHKDSAWNSSIYDFLPNGSFSFHVGSLLNSFTINYLVVTMEYTKTTD